MFQREKIQKVHLLTFFKPFSTQKDDEAAPEMRNPSSRAYPHQKSQLLALTHHDNCINPLSSHYHYNHLTIKSKRSTKECFQPLTLKITIRYTILFPASLISSLLVVK